jgi:hypothetical protein
MNITYEGHGVKNTVEVKLEKVISLMVILTNLNYYIIEIK